MRTNAPKKVTWWVAVVLGVLGILGNFVPGIPLISTYNFLFLVVGFILLALGTILKGF
jgi:hypothetical protein